MKISRIFFLIVLQVSIGCGIARAQWNCINTYDTLGYRDLYFINNDVGFVVGYMIDNQNAYFPGVILRTLDGGANWDTTFSNNYDGLWCVYFPDSMTGYAGGSGGAILKTSDGGDTWSYLAQPFGNIPWLACHFTSIDTGYFCCTSVGPHIAIMTTDGGLTWTQLLDTAGNAIGGHAIHFPSPDTGFIITSGVVYKTVDGGGSWVQQANMFPATCGARDIFFIDAMKGFAAGNGVGGQWGNYGSIAMTSDGAENWTAQSFYNNFSFQTITFTPGGRGYAAGQSNPYDDLQIFSTLDGGATWKPQQVNHGSIVPLFVGISAPSDSIAYAVSANGLIYKTVNGGGPLLSVDEFSGGFVGLSVYPVPSDNIVKFEFEKSGYRTIEVYDQIGREIWRRETDEMIVEFPASEFAAGMYFYSIIQNGEVRNSGKMIVE